MGEWIINYEDVILIPESQRAPYCMLVEDKKYARKGYLYLYNPPLLKDPWGRFTRKKEENIQLYEHLIAHFGIGALLKPAQLRDYLQVSLVRCQHLMQFLCTIDLAERYIAGHIIAKKERDNRIFGVHYLLKDKRGQIY